jgi:stage V sporulation protein D (sporulation-specific penicillin-binding protein)
MTGLNARRRLRILYGALLLVAGILVMRAFYLQVIRHSYYATAAMNSQLKQYEIPATRGIIEAHDGDSTVPVVLNQTLYTLFADPVYIKDTSKASLQIASIIGGNANEYNKLMQTKDTRYVVLAKKLPRDQKGRLDKLDLKGVGTRESVYRTYPEGSLAAQVLGFVNDEGSGEYGVEQALNGTLKGTPGQLKAITDAAGVPLVANKSNVIKNPVNGKTAVLSLDISMQKQLEDILKAGLENVKSKSGDAVILDPNTGEVKAMASWPSYNPAEYYKVKDAALFASNSVSSPLEIGSSMKPLTAAAALNQGVVKKDTTYFDPGSFTIDQFKITNIEEDGGAGTRSLADILQLSLNTGATWLLMQMGGGQVNQKARETWYDYMSNHYQFGKLTGIEQGYESGGTVPDPNNGYGLNLQFANTAFGQGVTATPLQLAAAMSSIVNGGTYYQPHLISSYKDQKGNLLAVKPKIVKAGAVKPETSQTIRELMEYTFNKNHVLYNMPNQPPQYNIGGKTGTAQIAKPGGGYYEDRFNGTFVGFVGGNTPQYVIVVRVNQPTVNGYAGSKAAAPIFSSLASMLINNFNVQPKS